MKDLQIKLFQLVKLLSVLSKTLAFVRFLEDFQSDLLSFRETDKQEPRIRSPLEEVNLGLELS